LVEDFNSVCIIVVTQAKRLSSVLTCHNFSCYTGWRCHRGWAEAIRTRERTNYRVSTGET